ncbi:hypothetical protein HHL24_01400 [Paraburkholderia sp. RP-4-7]|uniref:Uncharacterized protein n=1 Tax=Paraburkholderia polaris TaxID=2728848 RepID=A0A848I5U4_9BURK|nr:hypothetical protein [Paraburkholderia polaris]NML96622.1 hypothetical protein [Paraburkholderia polaris]
MKTVAQWSSGGIVAAVFALPVYTQAQATLPDGTLLISARIWQADVHVDSGHVNAVSEAIGIILNDPGQLSGVTLEDVIKPPSGFTLCGMAVTDTSINGGGGSWTVVYREDPAPSYRGNFTAVENQKYEGGTIKARLTIFAVPDGYATFISGQPQGSAYVWLTDKSNPLKISCTRNWDGGGNSFGILTTFHQNTDTDQFWSPVNIYLDPHRPPGCPPKGQPAAEQPRCGPPTF